MSRKLKDLTGKRIGRWTVLGRCGTYKYKTHKTPTWLCRCDCGQLRVVNGNNLRSGTSLSCGCLRSESVSRTQKYRHAMKKYGRNAVNG